jgi:copper chaperone
MIELTLPTMTCGHCVRAVTQAVQSVDPKASVQADLDTHLVRIETQLAADAFLPKLAEEGYAPAGT